MLELPSVTLIAIAGNKQGETVAALYKCMIQCKFASVKLITNIDIILPDIEVVNVGGLNTWESYNHFCIKELTKHFDSDMCLLVQWDGYILDAEQWDNEFFNYDYIGAKWLDAGKQFNIGNGGFSLRSKRLQDILATDKFISITTPEDVAICKVYGSYLTEHYGIKFATEEIADKFSFELNPPYQKTFGFHGFHQKPYKETIVLKRTGAMGDVVMMEPIMEYYHNKGYNVFVDTMPQYMNLFYQHSYPVKHISHLDKNIKPLVIDLDMSYEKNPKQLALKSYYETCGITDGELRNSRLFSTVTDRNKIFKNKYVVIHSDDTHMPYRNAYGIDWLTITQYLKGKGYNVFQVGKDNHIKIEGAIHFNTASEIMLLYLLKGANMVIGIDSGIAQISVSLGIETIIMSGSVDLKYRYINFDKIKIVHTNCPSNKDRYCYHEAVSSTVGKSCEFDESNPPCTKFSNFQIIEKIDELIKN